MNAHSIPMCVMYIHNKYVVEYDVWGDYSTIKKVELKKPGRMIYPGTTYHLFGAKFVKTWQLQRLLGGLERTYIKVPEIEKNNDFARMVKVCMEYISSEIADRILLEEDKT